MKYFEWMISGIKGISINTSVLYAVALVRRKQIPDMINEIYKSHPLKEIWIIRFIFICLPFVPLRYFSLSAATVTSKTQNVMEIINTKVPRNLCEFALAMFTSLSNEGKYFKIILRAFVWDHPSADERDEWMATRCPSVSCHGHAKAEGLKIRKH